jgi:hypothetical protein
MAAFVSSRWWHTPYGESSRKREQSSFQYVGRYGNIASEGVASIDPFRGYPLMSSTEKSLAIVTSFHTLLNSRKPDELLDLAADDIRIGGPRGSGVGKDLLYEWVGRANVTMTPQRTLARDGVVVVEQLAEWHDTNGDVSSSQTVASVFRIADGKITGIARHSHFAEAANKAGLDEDDEITAKPV